MARRGAMALLALVTACGYGSAAAPVAIRVAPVAEPGLDVDAAALVARAVRRAVARGPGTRIAATGAEEISLEVELLDAGMNLAAFADPNLRAAEYRATVLLRGRLRDPSGAVVWSSPVIAGESAVLSPPGRVEVLDGARRRSLEWAAEDAADRLVVSVRLAGIPRWRPGAVPERLRAQEPPSEGTPPPAEAPEGRVPAFDDRGPAAYPPSPDPG